MVDLVVVDGEVDGEVVVVVVVDKHKPDGSQVSGFGVPRRQHIEWMPVIEMQGW